MKKTINHPVLGDSMKTHAIEHEAFPNCNRDKTKCSCGCYHEVRPSGIPGAKDELVVGFADEPHEMGRGEQSLTLYWDEQAQKLTIDSSSVQGCPH